MAYEARGREDRYDTPHAELLPARIEAVADLVPLLFAHIVYKSHPESRSAHANMAPRLSPRRMQRTTIKGDYGLGYFENGGRGDKILEMTV